ncbi:ABC transporter substrate-binding protein [Alkalibacter rhizosphaerae]|uniref:ABC transporter substrate-binding protein n=1 Tax=Alkalibacter rhizosphaerae TaxID=2815577 RepID=A0A974XGK5_9FIRM|nr:glycine betaine ABC transporter substrate-binding protein [Alkalibacter rhizosphaerae]QSX09386.1 ABC transporter substrate-binding protein [Alkalibacter rhizosphaerae]
MKKQWKRGFVLLLVLLLAFSMVGCSGDGDDEALPEVINIGVLRVPNDQTLAIAEGLLDDHFGEMGIECKYIIFDSGVEANQALASGSIDFASMGNTNAIVSLARDLDVEMIWIHEILGDIEALAVKNDSGIEKVEDLAGERIATPFASTAHYILLNTLKLAGIENDVELLDMQTAEIVAAWERGDIKAAYTWQPSLGVLLQTGFPLVTSQDMAEKGFITANVVVGRKGFTEKYPELTAGMLMNLAKAGDIYRADAQEGARIVAEELEITPEDALMQMQGSIWKTPQELLGEDYFGTTGNPGHFAVIMKDTADFLEEQESIDQAPDQEAFNTYVNPKYIEMAVEMMD